MIPVAEAVWGEIVTLLDRNGSAAYSGEHVTSFSTPSSLPGMPNRPARTTR